MCRAAGGQLRQDLRRRQQQGGGHVLRPPLGAGIESADGVDLIVKKLAAHRLLHQGGEHVQNPAPESKLPHALHLIAAGVARLHQLGGQPVQIRPSAGFQRNGQRRQTRLRHGSGQKGVHRGNHHRRSALRHSVQRRQTAPLPFAGGDGVGPELPLSGKKGHRLRTGQAFQVACQLLGLPLIGAEKYHRALCPVRYRRADAGPLHRLGAGEDGGAAAVFHPADQFGNLRQGL